MILKKDKDEIKKLAREMRSWYFMKEIKNNDMLKLPCVRV